MPTVTINDLDGGVLAFDLRDVLRVLAPSSERATWTITHPDESPFEATGGAAPRLEKLAETSAQIGGSELLALADDTQQVIWGDFTGVLPDAPDQEWLTIRAFDSSFFEVTTSDLAAIAKLKTRFRDVRVAAEPI